MFSLKEEYTLRFLNCLLVALCNSTDNCWFDIISLLTADLLAFVTTRSDDFLSKTKKKRKPSTQVLLVSSMFRILSNSKCLLGNTLLEGYFRKIL